MKTSYCSYSITAALDACKDIMGPYSTISSTQDHIRFMNLKDKILEEMKTSGIAVGSIASFDYELINKWLEERKFSLRMPEFPNDGQHFGTAATLEVILKWLKPCIERQVRIEDGRDFPAFTLDSVKRFKIGNKKVYSLMDTNAFFVYMTECPMEGRSHENELDLLEYGVTLEGPTDGVSLVVPMIDYDQESVLNWMGGLEIMGPTFPRSVVEVAIQQNIFKMDEVGAEVKSASIIGYSGYSGYSDSGIDFIKNPFLLWIYAPNCTIPFFIGHFGYDCWKRPERPSKEKSNEDKSVK